MYYTSKQCTLFSLHGLFYLRNLDNKILNKGYKHRKIKFGVSLILRANVRYGTTKHIFFKEITKKLHQRDVVIYQQTSISFKIMIKERLISCIHRISLSICVSLHTSLYQTKKILTSQKRIGKTFSPILKILICVCAVWGLVGWPGGGGV